MIIRKATMNDLKIIASVEKRCFPEAEAATEEDFCNRLTYFPDYFWLLFDDNQLISFVDGFATDEPNLSDEMYEKAELHNENGRWQMIFGVNTIPEYRSKGYAAMLLREVIEETKNSGRNGIVLTCKEKLCSYYASFGFVNEGISPSVHGNAVWYQMRLTFPCVSAENG